VFDRCRGDVVDQLYGVRVAHADGGDGDFMVGDAQRLDQVVTGAEEWNPGRREDRYAHIDAHRAVVLEARDDDSAEGFDADFAFRAQPLLMNETYEAASAVAALLDFAAVGVEDAIAEIDVRLASFFNEQNLVTADAEVAVGEQAQLRRGQRDRLTKPVEDDEVVAQSVHLDECQLHGC